ncbi:hypothetical protein B0H14DRAFT_2559030 [Mycena olivaceomarginata]|nr:hypothetical protein B0H14DRAFT_2559030 [Mycena olivaceomarginata]
MLHHYKFDDLDNHLKIIARRPTVRALPLFWGRFEISWSANRLRSVGARERLEVPIFASSTSCRERRDLGALGPGSDECPTAGEGAGGDSGRGRGSAGNGSIDGPAEVTLPKLTVVQVGGSSESAPEGIAQLKSADRPKRAGSKVKLNVQGSALGATVGNEPPAFALSRLEESVNVLKSKLNDGPGDWVAVVGTWRLGAAGLNIAFCTVLIIFDAGWSKVHGDQVAGRINRRGQKQRSFVYQMAADGSIDMALLANGRNKGAMLKSFLSLAQLKPDTKTNLSGCEDPGSPNGDAPRDVGGSDSGDEARDAGPGDDARELGSDSGVGGREKGLGGRDSTSASASSQCESSSRRPTSAASALLCALSTAAAITDAPAMLVLKRMTPIFRSPHHTSSSASALNRADLLAMTYAIVSSPNKSRQSQKEEQKCVRNATTGATVPPPYGLW